MKEMKKHDDLSVENSEKIVKETPKKAVEVSEEAKENRRLLEAFLLDKKEELIKERNRRRKKIEEVKIELRGGKFISRLEIRLLVTAMWQNYPSIFPNDNRFFKNMFRLHPKLLGLDYKKYQKPRLAGRLLTKLTYDLFEIEVLPALAVLAMPDGKWLTKCYKYLTPAGIDRLIKFRDQANEMMDQFEDGQWYEFYKAFSAKYRRQPWLF